MFAIIYLQMWQAHVAQDEVNVLKWQAIDNNIIKKMITQRKEKGFQ